MLNEYRHGKITTLQITAECGQGVELASLFSRGQALGQGINGNAHTGG